MNFLRNIARQYCLTSNTLRYRIEYRHIKQAAETIGKPIDTLVDAGAGSGQMSKQMLEDGYAKKLIGVEPWDLNYSTLEANYKSIAEAQAIQAPLESIPLENNSVDGVLTTQVFEHIPDHQQAASELDRILQPEGHIIFAVPHPPEIFPNADHVRPGYTIEEVEALWQPLGYSTLLTKYYYTLPTLKRSMASKELPFDGKFLPIGWADREEDLNNEERKALQPYCILCLLKKDS